MIKAQKRRWRKFNSAYWTDTYVRLNPFMGAPRCPECRELPTMEFFPEEWINPATSVHSFKCANGHKFSRSRTHD